MKDFSDLPIHVKNIENLTVLEDSTHSTKTVKFEKERVFDDSLHIETIRDIRTDENGLIYIAAESWGRRMVYVFNEDGTVADSLGQMGTGDAYGDFQSVNSLFTEKDTLFVLDNQLKRVTTFFDENGAKIYFTFDNNLPYPDGISPDEFELIPFSIINSNSYLVVFRQVRDPAYEPEGILYLYILEVNESIEWTNITGMPDLSWLVGDYAGSPYAFTLQMPETSIFHHRSNNRVYAAHTSEFFIKRYSFSGELEKAYYFPFERASMIVSEINHPRFSHNRQVLRVRESADYPDHWPVIYSMVSDKNNRLWISTITENRAQLEWWIIDDDAEKLLTRFTWPFGREIIHINGDEVYTVEKNDMGFEIVVRYKLDF